MHPKETVNNVQLGENLNLEQKSQLKDLMDEFSEIFSDIPRTTNLAEHQIHLTSNVPVKCKPYAIPYSLRESLKKDIQEMQIWEL